MAPAGRARLPPFLDVDVVWIEAFRIAPWQVYPARLASPWKLTRTIDEVARQVTTEVRAMQPIGVMRTTSTLASIAAGALSLAACAGEMDVAASPTTTAATVSAPTATNPAVSFDRYRTFSFGGSEGPPAGYHWSPTTVEVQRRLRPLIAAALVERGYTPVPEKGDLLVMFGSGHRDVSEHEASDVGAGWLPNDENQDTVEGALVIDAFDGRVGSRVWHGATKAEVDPTRVDVDQLRRSVHEIMSAFPAPKQP